MRQWYQRGLATIGPDVHLDGERICLLALILDLFMRKVIGWPNSRGIDAVPALGGALRQAI